MQGFKDLIARRRPSQPRRLTQPLACDEPEAASHEDAAAKASEEPAPDAEEVDTSPVDLRDMSRARDGRDRVPKPDASKQVDVRPTMGEIRRRRSVAVSHAGGMDRQDGMKEADMSDADAHQRADQRSDQRPEPHSAPSDEAERPASKPQIWDLEQAQEVAPDVEPAPPSEAPGHSAAAPATTRRKLRNNAKTRPYMPIPDAGRDAASALAGIGEDALSPALRKPMSTPAKQQPRKTQDRAKTRLLGFHGDAEQNDVFSGLDAASPAREKSFPIGWLVVIEGPGRGASFTLTAGLSSVGRETSQTVSLDFGDTAISREGHISIAYDEEDNRAYIGHGGKSNIVRHNGKPLLSTEALSGGDTIRLGKTTLKFVAFCTSEFSWSDGNADAEAGEGGRDGDV